jgi:mRNA interferase RelE/StbE
MKVVLTKTFEKDYKKCPINIQNNIKDILFEMNSSDDILKIKNIKKLKGFNTYYRIRLGSYRIGLEVENDTIMICIMLTIKSRGDIYKHFPPK